MKRWPVTADELLAVQAELAASWANAEVVRLPSAPIFGGCFLAFAQGQAGPGHAGDRGWAAAVAWRAQQGWGQLLGQSVVEGLAPAPYGAGMLALREAPLLAESLDGLAPWPDVLLVDATGRDHPRLAGLALHLGAVLNLPTIGVTHRPLVASGPMPAGARRGDRSPLTLNGEVVGFWVCTRSRARPVVAHAAWRTTAALAVEVLLAASTESARTAAPLQQARRLAREARSLHTRGASPP